MRSVEAPGCHGLGLSAVASTGDEPDLRGLSHCERWRAGYEESPTPGCPYPWCRISRRDPWTEADCEGCEGHAAPPCPDRSHAVAGEANGALDPAEAEQSVPSELWPGLPADLREDLRRSLRLLRAEGELVWRAEGELVWLLGWSATSSSPDRWCRPDRGRPMSALQAREAVSPDDGQQLVRDGLAAVVSGRLVPTGEAPWTR